MRTLAIALTAIVVAGGLSVSEAQAACKGSNGRGWGSGRGAGNFSMTAADKACRISFPGFINDTKKTRIAATQVRITKQPKSGKVSVVAGKGILYTPKAGFKGKDRFCTSNTSPKVKSKKLWGCITVTVR